MWPAYGTWFSIHDRTIFKAVVLMATEQNQRPSLDFSWLAEYIREYSDRESLKSFLESVGVKQAIQAIGVEQTLAAISEKELLANLPPQRREKLRRLLQQESPRAGKSKKG
jgi:hypothetical protein